jgi:Rrf2 family iron-sulfur cluster assembly transcriptional regulator
MKLSTRSRYGTRLLADLAEHAKDGPIQLGDIAHRQGVSVKYLEQLVIPLKKNGWIKSVRGPKGGHMLAVSPHTVTIGDIVVTLEKGFSLTHCLEDPQTCDRYDTCQTRDVWERATNAMLKTLHSIKLSEIIK